MSMLSRLWYCPYCPPGSTSVFRHPYDLKTHVMRFHHSICPVCGFAGRCVASHAWFFAKRGDGDHRTYAVLSLHSTGRNMECRELLRRWRTAAFEECRVQRGVAERAVTVRRELCAKV
ncbi:MAG: hypothetical protein FJZ49_06845 [Candidatus Verstraetearchaeota archaeon]|nr:hypothetical protein [Candidatus Verstraetearchaeota archaeon]